MILICLYWLFQVFFHQFYVSFSKCYLMEYRERLTKKYFSATAQERRHLSWIIGLYCQTRTRTTLIMKREQNEAPTVIVLPPNREVNQFPESSWESSSPSSFLNGECLMSSLLHMLVWHHLMHVLPWHPAGLCQSRPQPMFFILPLYSKKQAFS